jgi:tetratricopeptide (TPR) repeat protein
MPTYYKHKDPKKLEIAVDLTKKKVLVVEDFFSFRLTLKNMLRSFNITDIDEAASGDEAIRKIVVKRYDIILCDYNLGPGKDGQQVLEEAKHREYINYTTIFMMVTAENTLDMFMGALEYQPDHYLMKPFTKEVLEKKILDLIRKKENLKDIDQAIEKKDNTTVLKLCEELIESNVRNLSELLKLKGEFLIKAERYQEAEAFYTKVLGMGNLPWASLGLGRVKFNTGHYEESKGIFENIITKNNKLMAAYDWLAKTYEKMGKTQEAQQILMQATELSPRAILRQKALGNLAYANKDLLTAQRALKETIKQGKYSYFKSPSDYTTLAKVLTDSGIAEDGIKVLNEAQKEFPDNPDAEMQIALVECFTYSKMNKKAEAASAAQKAWSAAKAFEGRIPPDAEMDMAKAFFLTGDTVKGTDMIRRLVQSNHEDQELIGNVQKMFKDLHMESRGDEIVSVARDEIISLNNDGVRLVREGNLHQAIEYFKKAAQKLPENKIINANAAQAMILYMKKFGEKERHLDSVKEYLDRVRDIDPSYRDLTRLYEMYNNLLGQG